MLFATGEIELTGFQHVGVVFWMCRWSRWCVVMVKYELFGKVVEVRKVSDGNGVGIGMDVLRLLYGYALQHDDV